MFFDGFLFIFLFFSGNVLKKKVFIAFVKMILVFCFGFSGH